MAECSTPIPDCDLTCEELECRLNAIDLNITNLFQRTDDINEYLDDTQWVIVRTAAELTAALLNGGTIFVLGTLTQSAGGDEAFTVTVDGTRIIGLTSPDGTIAKVVYTHSPSAARTVFVVEAAKVQIRNLEITTNHPLTADLGILDNGIITYGATLPFDTSDLVIDGCYIHHVSYPIRRASGAGNSVQYRPRVTNNYLYSFNGYGIYLDWGLDGALIENNYIEGKVSGDTHTTGNGIWVGDGADRTIIRANKVLRVDLHAIEFWHSEAGHNLDSIIEGNIITDCAFGITAIGNGSLIIDRNIIKQSRGLGIEIFNSATSLARYKVTNNTIDEHSFITGQVVGSVGMSIHGITESAQIENNYFGTIESPGTADAFAIQIIDGAENVTIKNNTFRDSGSRMIFINGDGVDVYQLIDIATNTFFYTDAFAALFPGPSYTEWESIRGNNVIGTISVKNNTVFYPSAETTFGIMRITNSGTVYSGSAIDAPIMVTGNIEESNLRIPY